MGSCAMLPRDKSGVVDERVVMYGTRNLRAVGASVVTVVP